MRMKKILSLILLLVCSACAMHYDVTLFNGNRFRAMNKPKLNDRGYFEFKDALGRTVEVNALRVRKIEAVNPGDPPSKAYD